jgi:hypothetical protein
MTKHLCQGPICHEHDTQSRVRGVKGSKVLRTRFARYDMETVHNDWAMNWEYYFCDERCMNQWLNIHMINLMRFVGIETKPKETPIDIVETTHQNWQGKDYTRTTIKFLSEPDINANITT